MNHTDRLDATTITSWRDLLRRKIIRRFLSIFGPMVAVFGVVNFSAGNQIIGTLEITLMVTTFMTWRFSQYVTLNKLEWISVIHIALLTYAFIFFSAVGDCAYIWTMGFPFFTCYLVGFRRGLVWSVGFALITVLTGLIVWQMGIELYWPWEMASYFVLAYAVMALFACFFALQAEEHIAMLVKAKDNAKEAAKALVDSEARYRTLLKSSLNAVGVHRDGIWIYVNPACVQLFGAKHQDEMLGMPIMDYIHADDRDMVLQRIEKMYQHHKPSPLREERLVRLNGDAFYAEARALPIVYDGQAAVMVSMQDISERKEHDSLQHQMEHSQRLESLGVLAGGIAHDFNNLLAAILGNAELASLKAEASSPTHKYLDTIKDACRRAAELCQQMLTYAGKGKASLQVIDLNTMIAKMEQLMQASISPSIEIKQVFQDDLPCVHADSAQLQQVILNFIVNAAEAIGDQPGTIEIRTGITHANKLLVEDFIATDLQDIDYIYFEVSDSGCGINAADMEKIFDPFFSTKHRGSGLGLSAILGIIRKHKGAISVTSELGQGSTFRIVFPLPLSELHVTTDTDAASEIKLHGSILVVDDDERVREVVSSMLSHVGIDVIEASNGVEAVDMFKEHHASLTAVVMDVTMPLLGGIEAMLRMRHVETSTPIILMSGYSAMGIEALEEDQQPNGFVHKPFEEKELMKVLKALL